MALSNTAVPKYYGMFRDAVLNGEIPVCEQISMQMNRIDDLIANPGVYYDDKPVEGFIKFCELELRKLFRVLRLSRFHWVNRALNAARRKRLNSKG